MTRPLRHLRAVLGYAALVIVVALVLTLAWLRWDAGRTRSAWFDERQGTLSSAVVTSEDQSPDGETTITSVRLTSDSGLEVFFRILRDRDETGPLPVLLLLGGHRTGSEAVSLFDDAGRRAVVALDYPYDGPQSVSGVGEFAKILPRIRRAFLDIPPAISLTVDWLGTRPWVDRDEIAMAGVSLGVPFATTAAARDDRLGVLLLAHGAADNRLWLQQNVARRFDIEWLQPPLATLLHWLAYGPVFDTASRVADVSPRRVIVVGARGDERTSEAQTLELFEAAREPKSLRWTEGGHVGPARTDIIEALVRIVNEELPLTERSPVSSDQ